jgi:uncharacterized protein (DUF58 family)
MKWFAGALLLLLVALAFGLGLLAYAMYALLGVMIASWFLARTWADSLAAVRQCNNDQFQIGKTVAVAITLENRGWLPIPWVLIEDLLPREALYAPPPRLTVLGRRLQLAMLWPGGKRTFFYQIRCNQRGYFQIGPLVLETGDLFGLHRRWRVVTEPSFILVYPAVVPLEGYELASRRPIGEIRIAHRLYEDPTRIAGVRAYQPGDSLNRIHWRATARTGVLHSKIYEPSSVAGATLVVDFHQAAYGGQPLRSEVLVTAAASLANAVYQMGQQVGLATNGRDAADRVRREGWTPDARSRREALRSAAMIDESHRLEPLVVPTQRGPETLMRIFETLARLELTDGLTLAQLLDEAAGRMPRDATVVALLPGVTIETAIALGDLRRRGFAVAAIVNMYYEDEYAKAAGLLIAQGIPTRQLKDNDGIAAMCREQLLH